MTSPDDATDADDATTDNDEGSSPRAALSTHFTAAAIRLNVVIWTNMDPDERAQRTCHKSPWFRII